MRGITGSSTDVHLLEMGNNHTFNLRKAVSKMSYFVLCLL